MHLPVRDELVEATGSDTELVHMGPIRVLWGQETEAQQHMEVSFSAIKQGRFEARRQRHNVRNEHRGYTPPGRFHDGGEVWRLREAYKTPLPIEEVWRLSLMQRLRLLVTRARCPRPCMRPGAALIPLSCPVPHDALKHTLLRFTRSSAAPSVPFARIHGLDAASITRSSFCRETVGKIIT